MKHTETKEPPKSEITILRDNREQRPWEFGPFDVTLRDTTLETGDYTVEGLCIYDEELDTYCPRYAVERKDGSDLVSSLTWEIDRFQDELERASGWESPLQVVIEEPRSPSRYQETHFMKYHDVDPAQVYKTIETLEEKHNVSFSFVGGRGHAQRKVYNLLKEKLQAKD